MIDNIAVVPTPSFHNLNHQAIETYLSKLPKGSRLYALSASHGEGIDKTKQFRADSNQLMYFSYSLINKQVLTERSINKLLESCAYLNFVHGLILILSLYDKIGLDGFNKSITEYSIHCQKNQNNVQLARMQLFLSRLSLFLTIFALERIADSKSKLQSKEA